MRPLPPEDLSHVMAHTLHVWAALSRCRLLITGGTGFFGKWIVETFAHANRELSLDASATIISRDPARFLRAMPHLAGNAALSFVRADVTTLDATMTGIDWIIHAATESGTNLNAADPLAMLDTTISGTRNVLEIACRNRIRGMLLTSSGAIYGPQPPAITHIPETYLGAPDLMAPASAYAHGKRVAEHLCAIYHARHELPVKIARCFAFTGPHLPLDAHFAAGNFMRDRLVGRPIHIRDGAPYRSYLYAADLVIWLWHILLRAAPARPYNVGSDEDISIAQFANYFQPRSSAALVDRETIALANRYVPSIDRARSELNLDVTIPLAVGLDRWEKWERESACA